MKIALATDHAGFEQLLEIAKYLESLGYECHNFGPKSLDLADDYPDFIFKAAEAVSKGECQYGIVLGSSGQGEAMAANRFKGVRCAVYYGPAVAGRVIDAEGKLSNSPYQIVKLSREHNHANMLSIAARFVVLKDILGVVKLWLDTPYSDEPRHTRRVEKLNQFGV
jgi:ribose 5-phosphate isomerase B